MRKVLRSPVFRLVDKLESLKERLELLRWRLEFRRLDRDFARIGRLLDGHRTRTLRKLDYLTRYWLTRFSKYF